MVVFFWIPGFFIVAVLIMALAVGVEVLQFVQNHILIISALLWLPMAWFVWGRWTDKTVSDDEKVETALVPIFAIPAYLVGAPFDFFLILLIGIGLAMGLMKLNEKVIKSKFVTLFLGILIAGIMTVIVWNWL